jgi:hypothetical protein
MMGGAGKNCRARKTLGRGGRAHSALCEAFRHSRMRGLVWVSVIMRECETSLIETRSRCKCGSRTKGTAVGDVVEVRRTGAHTEGEEESNRHSRGACRCGIYHRYTCSIRKHDRPKAIAHRTLQPGDTILGREARAILAALTLTRTMMKMMIMMILRMIIITTIRA